MLCCPKGFFFLLVAPWGDPEHRGGGMGATGAERSFGVQQGKVDAGLTGAQPWLQGSFCAGLEEVRMAWEQNHGKQEGEDKAWVSSWRWKKKRR